MAIVIQTLSDSSQARKDLTSLRSSVEGIQKSTEGLANRFASLGKALAIGATAAGAATGFIKLLDAATNLENRIKSVTQSAQEAKAGLWAINDIAIRTRTSVDATAKLYTKLTMASKDLGATQQQIAKATEAINQGFRISGASADEAKSAITQLSQAFASGKLAGDEFNSVMENAPFLAREIATGMGKTIGELYKMRDEGKLFAKDVLGGILKRTEQINKKFASLKITYGEAFANLGNSIRMLFNAVTGAFRGARGGPAEMINNWAIGIANFARNFTFYVLKAKTTAIGFVIDVTELFNSIWDGIKEGPQGIYKQIQRLVEFMKPYAQEVYNVFLSYSSAMYAGASGLFMAFLAWLRKSEQTSGLADYLEKANAKVLKAITSLKAQISKIKFGDIYAGLIASVKSAYERVRSYDFVGLIKKMWSGIKSIFNGQQLIDVNRFFPNLNAALDVVKSWAQKAAHWFWWLYDVVIGHSYIPDLVEGTIQWMSKLTGAPLGYVKAFVGSAAALFAGLNPFKTFGAGIGLFKKLAIAAGAVGIGVLGVKAVSDGPTQTYENATNTFTSAVDKFVKSPLTDAMNRISHSSVFSKLANVFGSVDNFFNGKFTYREQEMNGDVKRMQSNRTYFMDKLHIPREAQAAIGVGFTAAIAGAIMLAMNKGTTRSVILSVFTTAAGIGMVRGMDPKLLSNFFANGASAFLKYTDKGLTAILGNKISDDPFGFLSLIAKTSLLFESGRKYFLDLAKAVVTAPTKVGGAAANYAVYGSQQLSLKLAEKRLALTLGTLDKSLADARLNMQRSLERLANSTDAAGNKIGNAAAKLQVQEARASGGLTGNAAVDDAVQAQAQLEAAQAARNAPGVKRAESLRDAAKQTVEETKKVFAEQAKALGENIRSFGAQVGGVLGTGIGLQLGNDYLAQAEAERKTATTQRLTGSSNITMGGKSLTADQAGKVVSGEIKISNLDEASREFAKDIMAGLQVPAMQKLFIQLGSAAGGQAAGAMLGGMATGLGMALPGVLMRAILATKAGQFAFERAKVIAGFIFKKPFELAWEGTKAMAYFAAGKLVQLAGAVASGAAMAGAFIVAMVGWPALIVAGIVAALIGIYWVWENYGDIIIDKLKEGWKWVKSFVSDLFDGVGKIGDKIRENLPKWMGGKVPDQPPPMPRESNGVKSAVPMQFASGGNVRGPGTGTSDSIVARLSNGEFVVNAKAAAQHRGLLEAINNGLPGFAAGGSVGNTIGGPGISGALGNKIAEAYQQMAEAQEKAAKATVGWQRKMALDVVGEWKTYIEDMQYLMAFTGGAVSTEVEGGSLGADDDEKKKKEGKDKVEKYRGINFGELIDAINEAFPTLSLTLDQFVKMGDSARKWFVEVGGRFGNLNKAINDLPAGDPTALPLLEKLKTYQKDNAGKAAELASGRGFSDLKSSIESSGLGLSEEQFQLFTPENITMLRGYLDNMNKWSETIKNSPMDASTVRATRIAMINASEAMQEAITDITSIDRSTFAKAARIANKADVEINKDAFNRLSDNMQDQIVTLVNRIAELRKGIDEGLLKGDARINAMTEIDAKKKVIDKAMTKPTDKAKQAATDFASGMQTTFADSLSNFFKHGTFDVLGIAMSFRDRLIDGFTSSLSEAILGPDTKGAGIMGMFGAGAQTAGAQVGGGGTGGIGGLLGGLFSGKKRDAEKTGEAVAAPVEAIAPTLGTDAAKSLVDTGAGTLGDIAGAGIVDKVKGALGGGGGSMIGLAGMGGSLFGMLLGGLFAEGGSVSGPGTSTSDSIPALLSNGEFVVRAKQAAKYRGLLTSINNGSAPKFAEGGLVTAPTSSATYTSIAKSANPKAVSQNKTDVTIVGDISRQTRKEIFGLLPQIAAGVNSYNKEKGIR